MSESLENTLRVAERTHASGDYSQAAVAYRAILSEYPYFYGTAYNLGNILKEEQQYAEAELCYRQALSVAPDLPAAILNLAFVLQEQGKFDEALSVSYELVRQHPDLSDAVFNLACLQLLTGYLPDGWSGYEERFRTQIPVMIRHTDIPLWNGELTSGVRLLVHTEQGYGDALQMCRYLPVLSQSGVHVWLETTPVLAPLLKRLPGLHGCFLRGESLPYVDCQASVMSLPGLLKTTVVTIPPLPEIAADEALMQRMNAMLPKTGKLRVGLCWTGRLDLTVNRKRSCPPEYFVQLLDQSGITAVSLQIGQPDDLTITDARLIDPTESLVDFHHTAALMANLDLVITIDSAVAHLAGTLGKPTWLLLPFVPDWRWLLNRDDSPWYPTMRIFRQPGIGDWTSVMQNVAQSLADLLAESAAALTNRGAMLDGQGLFDEALSCYNAATARCGTNAVTWYNMGNTLKNLGLPDQAIYSYQQAILLNPEIPEAYHNLALINKEQGAFEEAYGHLKKALELRPHFPDALHTLGELFLAEERFTDAISSLRTALVDAPLESRIWNTLGIVYQCAERDQEAKECYQEALVHNPAHLHALNNMGAVCLTLGQPAEGVEYLTRLLAINPDYADGHWNLAGCLLASGQYKDGWCEYEWRWRKNSPIEARHQEITPWNGEPLDGQRILVWAEQGFGDTIQFIRYAMLLNALGGRIVLECQTESIRRLCEAAAGVEQVIVRGESLPPVDFQAPLLSLPGIMGTALDTIPADVPYLKIDPERRQRWLDWISGDSGLRVGLVWGGRQTLRNRRRSSSLADFAPLADSGGITFYSLQVGEQADEAAFPPVGMILRDPTPLIKDFADTAALIDCLDLVVTIDTSVAHLAGALGKPVRVLLPTAADWRWLTERSDSPWYPTMILLRQQQAGDWHGVIAGLAAELAALLQGGGSRVACGFMDSGDQCRDRETWEEAYSCYLAALAHNPLQADAHLRAGGCLIFLNRHEEAIPYLHRAIRLNPDDPAPHISLSIACLATGRYDEGWREFEWRRHNITEPFPPIEALPLLKNGERLDGITVLVHTEQGFGDTLQMIRYLPLLTGVGANVILSVPPVLERLFQSLGDKVRIIAHGELLPDAHYQTLLMSLPFLLGEVSAVIPEKSPYLNACRQSVEEWKQRLDGLDGLKIGIAWQGRNMQKSGYRRAMSLEQLTPLFNIPGVSFVTLQPQTTSFARLHDMSSHIKDFADTAALIANLDLVITVDTAVAHLAGAMGRPCWIALLFSPDWRWFPLQQENSNWYPSTTLFRQKEPGEWGGVIAEITERLANAVSPRIWCYRAGQDFDVAMTVDRPTPLSDCSRWPELGLRQAESPETADWFLFPYYLEHLAEYYTIEGMWRFLEQLPFFAEHQDRHILFSDHDCEAPFHSTACWFRASVNPRRHDPAAFIIPYQVSIADESVHFELSRIRYHVSFTGFLGQLRERMAMINGVIAEPRLFFELDLAPSFHLHQTAQVREERRIHYLETSGASICVLCPRGEGSSSQRLFETMALGRIAVVQEPILLPFSDRIDYARFVISIPEGKADETGAVVHNWIFALSGDELMQRCREARTVWESYLSPRVLAKTVIHRLCQHKLSVARYQPAEEESKPAPDWQYHLNRAASLLLEGKQTEAMKHLAVAQSDNPRSATIHVAMGGIEQQLGNYSSAEAHLLDAILYDHRCYDAYLLLGTLIAKGGQPARAVGRFYQASMVRPDELLPYELAEPLLCQLGRLDEAAFCRDKLAELTCLVADQREDLLVERAHELGRQGRLQEAVDLFKEATKRTSPSCSTWLNLAIYLHAVGQTAEGLAALKQAVEIKPDYAEAWQNMGLLHQALGDVTDAYLCFRRALVIRPDYPTALWNLALLQLLLGDFEQGFSNFEQRFLRPDAVPQRHSDLPGWRGEDIAGKTLLVVAEQGYGDTIQFIRYLPLLAGQGIRIVVEVHDKSLLELTRAMPGVHTVVTRDEPRPEADFQIPILSMAFVCGTTPENIPPAPYLVPDALKVEKWRQLFGDVAGLKVGIVWSGSRIHKGNSARSIAFKEFSALLNVAGATFFTLQIGADALTVEDATACQAHPIDLTSNVCNFSDTAAFIANLDLIISVDTSTAHLAGALGKPTWVLLPFAPDWRWILGRQDSPWYPSMKLFRQQQPGEWGGVLIKLAAFLGKMVSEHTL